MIEPVQLGKLYLIPTPITENGLETIPDSNIQIIHMLKFFIAEKARTCRRYLKTTQPPYQIAEISVEEIPREVDHKSIAYLLKPLLDGHDMGFMAEAGCPGIADPGSKFVAFCHKKGIQVVPLTGPSSILLALMASGMNGQQFTFNGYLPAKREMLRRRLQQLEQRAIKYRQTQIFIETPYRNRQIIEEALQQLSDTTLFCIGLNLSGPDEWVKTATINQWKKMEKPEVHKVPAIFLIGISG
jgi:16S rRNA (cytidine1402-2'-O)-methyltransferase